MADLVTNINRAIADFDSIKSAIEDKGVTVGNAPTSKYADRIAKIQSSETQYLYNSEGRIYAEDLVIPDGIAKIGAQAYYLCDIKSLIIPNSVKSIGNSAFYGCKYLTNLVIPEGVGVLGQNAFYSCPIDTLYLPSTLASMGASVFSSQYLRNITLGQGFNFSINISGGTYDVDVMLAMFNVLKDNTGATAKTLQLGSKNLAKLTAEQIQIATDKNWNVA